MKALLCSNECEKEYFTVSVPVPRLCNALPLVSDRFPIPFPDRTVVVESQVYDTSYFLGVARITGNGKANGLENLGNVSERREMGGLDSERVVIYLKRLRGDFVVGDLAIVEMSSCIHVSHAIIFFA